MPFTFSHPAAVLPLYKWSRRPDLLLPLAVGSVMPDFGYYYAPFAFFKSNAHTLIKSFTFCLPLGMLCLALIYVLQKGWMELLPSSKLRAFAQTFLPSSYNKKFIFLSIVAIVVGSWTHIFWDAFTHKNGFLVQLIPALSFRMYPGIEVFRVLQHISTLAGAWILFNFYRNYPYTEYVQVDYRSAYYFIFTANAFSLYYALTLSPFQWFFFITGFFKCFFLIVFLRSIVIVLNPFRKTK